MSKKKKSKSKSSKTESNVYSGKRKEAIARAVITKGDGKIRINSVPLRLFKPRYMRLRIKEPLVLAGDLSNEVDIDINVSGGGISGQADAVRLVIANALVGYSKDDKLRDKMLEYDRRLIVADPRRKETRKPGRSSARSAAQKSKR